MEKNIMAQYNIKKGDVYMVRLTNTMSKYALQGNRPCVIVQNNVTNVYSDTTMIVPLTSNTYARGSSRHPLVNSNPNRTKNFYAQSVAICDNVIVIDKSYLERKVTTLCQEDMERIEKGLLISLGFDTRAESIEVPHQPFVGKYGEQYEHPIVDKFAEETQKAKDKKKVKENN